MLHVQEHVAEQGDGGGNLEEGEGTNFQPSGNPDAAANQYCEAAGATQHSGAKGARFGLEVGRICSKNLTLYHSWIYVVDSYTSRGYLRYIE